MTIMSALDDFCHGPPSTGSVSFRRYCGSWTGSSARKARRSLDPAISAWKKPRMRSTPRALRDAGQTYTRKDLSGNQKAE